MRLAVFILALSVTFSTCQADSADESKPIEELSRKLKTLAGQGKLDDWNSVLAPSTFVRRILSHGVLSNVSATEYGSMRIASQMAAIDSVRKVLSEADVDIIHMRSNTLVCESKSTRCDRSRVIFWISVEDGNARICDWRMSGSPLMASFHAAATLECLRQPDSSKFDDLQRILLANRLIESGEFVNAISVLSQDLSIKNDVVTSYRSLLLADAAAVSGNSALALQSLEACTLTGNDDPFVDEVFARVFLSAGRNQLAYKHAQSSADRQGLTSGIAAVFGTALIGMGQPKNGVEKFLEGLQLAPGDIDCFTGLISVGTEDLPRYAEVFWNCYPDTAYAYRHIQRTLYELGNWPAIERLDRLDAPPDVSRADTLITSAIVMQQRGDVSKARTMIAEAVQLGRSDKSIDQAALKAWAIDLAAQSGKAVEAFRDAGENFDSLVRLASRLELFGDRSQLMELLDAAVKASPDDWSTNLLCGKYYKDNGSAEKARQTLERSVSLARTSQQRNESVEQLSLLLCAEGLPGEAIAAFRDKTAGARFVLEWASSNGGKLALTKGLEAARSATVELDEREWNRYQMLAAIRSEDWDAGFKLADLEVETANQDIEGLPRRMARQYCWLAVMSGQWKKCFDRFSAPEQAFETLIRLMISEARFNQAVELCTFFEPKSGDALAIVEEYKGRALTRLGRNEEALATLSKALKNSKDLNRQDLIRSEMIKASIALDRIEFATRSAKRWPKLVRQILTTLAEAEDFEKLERATAELDTEVPGASLAYYRSLVHSSRGDHRTAYQQISKHFSKTVDNVGPPAIKQLCECAARAGLTKDAYELIPTSYKSYGFTVMSNQLLELDDGDGLSVLLQLHGRILPRSQFLALSAKASLLLEKADEAFRKLQSARDLVSSPEELREVDQLIVESLLKRKEKLTSQMIDALGSETIHALAGRLSQEREAKQLEVLLSQLDSSNPKIDSLALWHAELAWLERRYKDVISILEKDRALLLADPKNLGRYEDRYIRSCLRLGELDRASRIAAGSTMRDGDPWYEFMVAVSRGDVEKARSFARTLKNLYDRKTVVSDEDIGNSLMDATFTDVNELFQ